MSNSRKYLKYLIALIMIISLGGNLFLAVQLRTLKNTMGNSNLVISTRVESYIRDTMRSIKAFRETGTREDMVDLQRSVQQLVSSFNNWVDLNQDQKSPNEPLMEGLRGLEALRNTIVHHLGNQYSSRNEELTDYDIEVLDKIHEQLDRLLVVYSNVQGRVNEIKNLDNSDGGLGQWANNMKEISKLYRHSRISNEHPKYIGLGSVLKSIHVMFPEISNMLENETLVEKIKENVEIQDGVHYYEATYYIEDELIYSIWIDGIDGSLRQFNDYTKNGNDIVISEDQALNIAKQFMNRFTSYDKIIDGVSLITDENTKNTIYAFQFIPVSEDITIISDRVKVNISSQGGRVLRYSSNFSGTMVPVKDLEIVELADVEEKYSEQVSDMKYVGMSVVRSFYTHYRPVLAYSYQSTQAEEMRKLYFDVTTGNQVFEAYSVYEPVSYIITDEYY